MKLFLDINLYFYTINQLKALLHVLKKNEMPYKHKNLHWEASRHYAREYVLDPGILNIGNTGNPNWIDSIQRINTETMMTRNNFEDKLQSVVFL